jgi:hypothetical protein
MTRIVALTALFLFAVQARAHAFPIIDTLGNATPAMQFSILGHGGVALRPTQFIGPLFRVIQPTVLTEIGTFLNNATGSRPFTVRIYRSKDGLPDPQALVTTLSLSHDRDPLVVSYESVTARVVVGPGTYFALFAPQDGDGGEGDLLAAARTPFDYRAGTTTLACLGKSCGSQTVFEGFAALRILGEVVKPAPKPALFFFLDSGLTGAMLVGGPRAIAP